MRTSWPLCNAETRAEWWWPHNELLFRHICVPAIRSVCPKGPATTRTWINDKDRTIVENISKYCVISCGTHDCIFTVSVSIYVTCLFCVAFTEGKRRRGTVLHSFSQPRSVSIQTKCTFNIYKYMQDERNCSKNTIQCRPSRAKAIVKKKKMILSSRSYLAVYFKWEVCGFCFSVVFVYIYIYVVEKHVWSLQRCAAAD